MGSEKTVSASGVLRVTVGFSPASRGVNNIPTRHRQGPYACTGPAGGTGASSGGVDGGGSCSGGTSRGGSCTGGSCAGGASGTGSDGGCGCTAPGALANREFIDDMRVFLQWVKHHHCTSSVINWRGQRHEARRRDARRRRIQIRKVLAASVEDFTHVGDPSVTERHLDRLALLVVLPALANIAAVLAFQGELATQSSYRCGNW
jgi:hypothetical protein